MRVIMNYGKKGLPLDFPDNWDVTLIKKTPMPVLEYPAEAARLAFSNPVKSKSLVELATYSRSACILICDITRPVPNDVILPVLIRELMDAGMDPDHITVLVATGLHRPNLGEELGELVGNDWVLDSIEVSNHFARNDEDHIDLGTTNLGTPVKIDRRFVEADLRIVTGLVEPHFMAGYSGGRKVVMPGVAHQETITVLHSARFLENPHVVNCVLEKNPFHEEQLEIVRKVGKILAINTVIDEARNLAFINFGDIEESHREAVSYIKRYAELPMAHKFDTVITSAAGYPLDKTYYQTIKGMVGAMEVLAKGGNLFIVSECSEGLGSPEFITAQKRLIELGRERFLNELLQKRSAAIDEWQTEMLLKPMRIGNIHLYTEGLSKSELELTGVQVVKSFKEAIGESVVKANDKGIAIIPEGPYVIPLFRVN